jgi:hypothetical protein
VYYKAINLEQRDFKKNEIDAINRLIKKDPAARINAKRSYLIELAEKGQAWLERLRGPFGL